MSVCKTNLKSNLFSKNLNNNYLDTILNKSEKYLKQVLDKKEYKEFLNRVNFIYKFKSKKEIIKAFKKTYYDFMKQSYQKQYKYNEKLDIFINDKTNKKIIWGDCFKTLKKMKSESIACMVTSPPYYNAREYAKWDNLNAYFADMKKILKECYRVLDNHRVFIFNVGDIFDNDNLFTTSTWGKRRLPLGAYFINLFEKVGFTFVDDIIWDKGEVQSQRHKNGDKPYPFYQYPMNCYEHILVFHKHRQDNLRYPCPVCGCLQVNGNAYTEKGLKSWECKNLDCFERSAANRGKRFSAKTYFTQNEAFNQNSQIDKDFIYAWRRDIKKINPVIKINSKKQNFLGHSAPFPKEIPEFAIRMFSYKGEKVLDPFMGIGTSVKVANELGRIGIGIERDLKLKESIYKFLDKDDLGEYKL
ncbi:TPA: site-specific DNA-methyltransferase [Campylobacter jejuni]|uniref:DNA-methyltransferase n=1 Tax=Campylobacter TaxID=194 RepID=UPI0008758F2B|nr:MULTISPECIES: site-specific DNA-methyltransferase [Campylobacter]EAI8344581.1 site-specific DNA-methyltransferase [Campylobacter jejuni]EAK4078770.1 site-specific DNA-methyltransferase [Campylobacter jejuni]EAK4906643.1 site-specific DNA-methyltransferase [Campylobacter jejuni]ECH4206292.1 site-specific DNA-methyltransferase [Campylobacter jejuni]ECH4207117.1 site-specific DNA-methyltransferase [Campylobacter jejuni]